MIILDKKTNTEINRDLAKRLASIRKRRKISQKELARVSGVSCGSIRRFEQTGDISLYSLTNIAIALKVEDEIDALFTRPSFSSIEEILNG